MRSRTLVIASSPWRKHEKSDHEKMTGAAYFEIREIDSAGKIFGNQRLERIREFTRCGQTCLIWSSHFLQFWAVLRQNPTFHRESRQSGCESEKPRTHRTSTICSDIIPSDLHPNTRWIVSYYRFFRNGRFEFFQIFCEKTTLKC